MSADGIATAPNKTETVGEWPSPKSVMMMIDVWKNYVGI